ncbi:hypothetical protein [Micromonospora zhanjiangensis]|uniref:Uncharacterized protein n=1 Tax=Micromonospora zhanjiangensis TaxID=1522057 RepID=A0ABV8KP86_9ACTN
MSRRTIATVKRPAAHRYTEDQAVPGRCTCGLPQVNGVHEVPDAGQEQAEHRRRAGDDA